MTTYFRGLETITKIIKHDKYQQQLYDVIKESYDFIYTNVPVYSKRNRIVAEIDILAYKNGFCDVFEIKCSHRITKAKKQLFKIQKLLEVSTQVRNLYFFCGISGELLPLT